MNKPKASAKSNPPSTPKAPPVRTCAKRVLPDPTTYKHAHKSMPDYARLLTLQQSCLRTRQAYYRLLRLLADHIMADPASLKEAPLGSGLAFKHLL